jgi:ABC-type bacteriocin/lantibiotic exporter with double-glycine peptidase domain
MGIATGLLAMLTLSFTGIIFDTIIPGCATIGSGQSNHFSASERVLLVRFFNLTRSFAVLRLEGKMDASTQAAVWDRTISLPVPFFRNYTAG